MPASILEFTRQTDLDSAAISATAPEARDEWWEGQFDGETGVTSKVGFNLRAMFTVWQGAASGVGRGIDFPVNEDEVSITGTLEGYSAELLIWLQLKNLTRKPLICIGTCDMEAGRIAGKFSVDCMNPKGCGCEGGTGRFQFTRMSQTKPDPLP